MTKVRLKPLSLLSLTLLSACATHAPQTPVGPLSTAPKANVAQDKNRPIDNGSSVPSTTAATEGAAGISSWEITGAIAARNPKKAWTASVNWLQQGLNHYQIRLLGPLGGGTVIVEKQGGVISYRDGPKKITSHDADQLLQQQTGVRLPVGHLYYWVRGIPAPGAVGATNYDEAHHLMSLSQSGYQIHYSQYTTVGKVVLPTKLQLTGHGIVIKFVIKHWRV